MQFLFGRDVFKSLHWQLPKVLLCFSLILVTVLAFAFAISGMTREADREGQVAPEIERFGQNLVFNLQQLWEETQFLVCDDVMAYSQ